MSWEEDLLMQQMADLRKRVDAIGKDLKAMLNRCEKCTTAYAKGLESCPNCGEPKEGVAVSPGDSSKESMSKQQQSVKPKESPLASPAQTTENPSSSGQTDASTADSTAGPTKVRRTTPESG